MTATTNGQHRSTAAIASILDTDLYKLTMQCAILRHFPHIPVAYKFTNRTSHMRLNRHAFHWLQEQIARLADLIITDAEMEWLRQTCPYLSKEYLSWLQKFRLKPWEQVRLRFVAADGQDEYGELELSVVGLWVDTILYEIPLLAMVSEAYFKFVDTDWSYGGQVENAKAKALQLLEHGCVFSEFGSRRRRDSQTHEMVMQGLLEAQRDAETNGKGWKGKFTGTSNVHMARRFGTAPIGTVAHEWFMGIAAITDNYSEANERALQYWTATFGRGVLAIALTDTFGTPAFLRSFRRTAPKKGTNGHAIEGHDQSYAEIFTGVRQDSGDPLHFIKLISSFYASQNIREKKMIIFSDSLNVDKCLQYQEATDDANRAFNLNLLASFGIGTFFTNDFRKASRVEEKSVPLNIVIKLSEAEGRPAVKLSDDVGKNMGEEVLVRRIKKEVGYQDSSWGEGDEAHRWD